VHSFNVTKPLALLLSAALGCGGLEEPSRDDLVVNDAGDASRHDATSPFDARPPQLDATLDAPVECAPADMTGFVPKWTPPAAPRPVCTTRQIGLFYCACLLSGICAQNCSRFGPGGTAEDRQCAACLVTQSSAAEWGPVVVRGGGLFINYAGCVALQEGKRDGSGCGGAMTFAEQCEDGACAANCPMTDDLSYEAYRRCVEAADRGACARYVAAAACAPAILEAGAPGAECLRPQSFYDAYLVLAEIFCGGVPDDAGARDAASE
jgi:hypothetical protein